MKNICRNVWGNLIKITSDAYVTLIFQNGELIHAQKYISCCSCGFVIMGLHKVMISNIIIHNHKKKLGFALCFVFLSY